MQPSPRALVAAVAAALLAALVVGAAPARQERPLPAFQGTTFDGQPFSVGALLGRRLLVLFLRAGDADAERLARAAALLAAQRGAYNFEIVGIVSGVDAAGEASLAGSGADVPLVRDPAGAYGGRIGVRSPAAAVLADAEGYLVRGSDLAGPSDAKDPVGLLAGELRSWLRIPDPTAAAAALEPSSRPAAPDFRAERLDGSGAVELASLRGRPAVLIFFLHTCPHCHHALAALKEQLAALPEDARPTLLGVSVAGRADEVQESLEQEGLDFFPVLGDAGETIRTAYAATSGVPVLIGIDREHRVAWRTAGWRDERDPALLRMRLALLAGQTPPMLLHTTGYSGEEFCATCHPGQHDTWLLTAHSEAYDTLVRHGADRDTECVGCHVVGFGKAGGFDPAKPARELEGVGCEICHGRGGPHLSPGFVQGGNYEPVCVTCHDPKHSLGFEYAAFLPRVSHAANAQLASLSAAERQKLLAERRARREALLPTNAAFVGSAGCRECHAAEHASWSAQPHARALATLAAKERAADAECQRCHTTGFGKPGGFPAGGAQASHPDLAGVGCESCHGPGGEHVKPDAAKRGTILALADKCDSCVILQICGSCHDDANDPGFEYEVKAKIEAQRHGRAAPATATGARAGAPEEGGGR
ncbi:MAG TPA: multiheme c-type cytochrome [Myxococcota bacterium]|nr:multiheme c-type cytochrome [Myxococcota bacterium]